MAAEDGGGRFAAALVFDLLHLNAGAGEPVTHGEGQPRGGGGAGEYELAGFLLGGGSNSLRLFHGASLFTTTAQLATMMRAM